MVAPDDAVKGVFEIYSDVTPLLLQIDAASARVGDVVDDNYLGRRIIDAEARAREQSVLREQEWHRDKMAAMAAMAANISHEVGNPLAIIAGLADEIALWRDASDYDAKSPRMIQEQTARIANMTRRITDFATAGHETPEPLDVNHLIRAVCDFLAFDRRFRGTPIELRLGDRLPACQAIPDHLTEVLMSLLQALEETSDQCPGPGKRIFVESESFRAGVRIRIGCECSVTHEYCRLSPSDSRVESARRRLEAMGSRIESTGRALEIHLGCVGAPASA